MDDKRKGYLYLLITFFLWGSLYVVSKFVLGKLPTFTVAFGRYFISYLVLSLMALTRPKTSIAKEDRKYIFVLGFLGYFLSVGLQLVGTKLAGATVASLINSMNPITIALMAMLVLHEKLTIPKEVGIALSLAGVYLIIGNGTSVDPVGLAVSLLSVVGWSFMSVVTRKVTQKYDALTVTRAAIGITVICDLPACLLEMVITGQRIVPDMSAFLGLLYIAVFCTALTLVLWNKSLSLLPAGVCSSFYPIQTLTSSVLGILIFHEKVGMSFVAGSVLIVLGVLVSLLVKPHVRHVHAKA